MATSATAPAGVASAPESRSEWSRAARRFRSNHAAVAGLAFCILLVAVAIAAPLVAPYGYAETDYDAILEPNGSPGHPFGTDQLGRDIASRLVFSLRTALIVAVGAEVIALAIALVIGLTAGYVGGRTERGLMAFIDVMYAYPSYLLAIILVTVLGRNVGSIALAIGVASFVTQTRLVRAQVLTLKQREYVEAARAMGATGPTIAIRYILPNAVGPILVTTSFGIPAAIVTESGLALLGLGVQPPTPSWGTMIADGTDYVTAAPHMLLWPAVLFALTMLAFTWVGDGVRDAFDVSE